ncbi:membrane protein DedA with SNARE-associated domain [Micromonospora pisi]|uniref:Membrane protein DedA with SNARE-associated domain n=1 Tax=Micromonospora pisi TaxID=589240 RepID=A0A495JGY7_9ACTN|nr:DedA family protein [Micromonospora pisi]RKR88153.1 membrane protein DedA with SNARE-associated domain [Micromonospora pisi]
MLVVAEAEPTEIGGLTGWVASVIDALGPLGVGLLVALENLVPPVPSEVVLALAGYLAGEGRGNVVVMWVAATAGSVLGALALYWVGAALGEERLKRWLDRVPLVDAEDLDRADRWFARYGNWAVLLGRMVPVVRSLVSVPAGADGMPIGRFLALTTLGSGIWNSIFVGLGFALGSRWQQIDRYSTWFDLALLAGFVLVVSTWVVKRLRRRRQPATPRPSARPDTGQVADRR